MQSGSNSTAPIAQANVVQPPAPPKPVSLWFGQAFLCLCAIVGLVFAVKMASGGLTVILSPTLISLVSIALIVGIQRRTRWAHWGIIMFLGCFALNSIRGLVTRDVVADSKGPLQLEVRSEERAGATLGAVMYTLALCAFALRVGFSSGVKAYFGHRAAAQKRASDGERPLAN